MTMKRKIIPAFCTTVFLLLATGAVAQKEAQHESVDLDGDGIEENVRLEYSPYMGDFMLGIDDLTVENRLEPELTGLEIIDIDTSDDFLEVKVSTPGPSDDPECFIYALMDGEIVEIGHICGWMTFPGNGTALVEQWMGFWSKTEMYALNPDTHQMEVVPQELYVIPGYWNEGDIGIECTVLESFPIHASHDDSMVLEDLEEGSAITLVACRPGPVEEMDGYMMRNPFHDWYLIMTQSGVTGWAQLETFQYNIEGIHRAD